MRLRPGASTLAGESCALGLSGLILVGRGVQALPLSGIIRAMKHLSESLDKFGLPLEEAHDYRGEHEAPGRDGGAPLHAVSPDIYPEDIYSVDGARYYGDNGGDVNDSLSVGIIKSTRGRPNASIKIYRAVPKVLSREDRIADIEAQMRYILKHGKVPPYVSTDLNPNRYYEKINHEMIEIKKTQPSEAAPEVTINPGDWVTINRNYAKDHGESNLNGQYKILTKTVKAKDLFTDGNSVHEWGYDPS